jgi:hypothetical protein
VESNQSNDAPRCDGPRRKIKFKSETKRVVGPIKAFICADAWSNAHGYDEDDAGEAEISPAKARSEAAAEARRVSRAEEKAQGIMQYVVKVPIKDEGAKSMRWSLGQSAISKSPPFSAVSAVMTNESLQAIVTSVSAAPGSEHLLAEISERKDLREFTEAVAANDKLFSLLAAVAADPKLQAIVRAASTVPGLADLLLEISRRANLKKLTEALSANDTLAYAVSELAKASSDLLGSLTEIIRAVNGDAVTGGDTSPIKAAVLIALQDAEVVVKVAAVRGAGGIRARIVSWLLDVG